MSDARKFPASDILATKMKNKKITSVAISISIALLFHVSWTMVGFMQIKTESANLSFKGKINKETFTLGEPISVEFEISNEGETSIGVHTGGVETGFLKVFIASQDGEYKEYFGYGWGLKMGRISNLDSKESRKYKVATILWQGKPDISGLNEQAAKEKLKGKIITEYALPEPGVYFIKGISYVGENATPIETQPIQIVINEPVGDDLKVWNQIKSNREIALLMQTGEFDTGKDGEKAKLVKEVEQILEKYPNSTYSSYLNSNLEKFKTKEARRNEFHKNVKQRQKPEN